MQVQTRQTTMFRPHVEARPCPINRDNDDFEYDSETTPLYHVNVSQGKLKMLFLVAQKRNSLEYDILRCEYLTLDGIDERNEYLNATDNISVSADPSIVNQIFGIHLEPFGIRLLDVTFHNFEFFESAIEGKGFVFEDTEKHAKLKALIQRKCLQMLHNPYIIEY